MASNHQPIGPQHQGQAPANANPDSSNELFQQELRDMEAAILNKLNMSSYTRRQRHLIDQERCRRKNARKAATANNQAAALPSQIPTTAALPSQLPTTAAALQLPHTPSITYVALGVATEPSSSQETQSSSHIESPKSWYLFQEYHESIIQQVAGVCFESSDISGVYEWPTNVLGTFQCSQSKKKCQKGWKSGVVSTVIRKYLLPGNKLAYNAKVFNQRCARCKSLGYMTIDRDVYIERVVRRLKIWKHEEVDELPIRFKETKPHKTKLCEGCKVGCCQRENGTSES